MTARTNARLAGAMFLLYIATGIASMILFQWASGSGDVAEQLASLAAHAKVARATAVLSLAMFVYAVGLGVTLWALTRDQDRDLALFAMCCRVGEGVIGAVSGVRILGLVAVATASTAAAGGPEAAATQALGALLLKQDGASYNIGATCFAFGSAVFSYLFLRARSIPVWLAWLGVVASLLLVALLPLRITGCIRTSLAGLIWIPMALFEVVLAVWLIVRGVAVPERR